MLSGDMRPTTKGSFGADSRLRKKAMSRSRLALYMAVVVAELLSPWCHRIPLRSTAYPAAFAAAIPLNVCLTASAGRS